jgi:hypothetical protein
MIAMLYYYYLPNHSERASERNQIKASHHMIVVYDNDIDDESNTYVNHIISMALLEIVHDGVFRDAGEHHHVIHTMFASKRCLSITSRASINTSFAINLD